MRGERWTRGILGPRPARATRLLATGYWLLATAALATGYWLLATGCGDESLYNTRNLNSRRKDVMQKRLLGMFSILCLLKHRRSVAS